MGTSQVPSVRNAAVDAAELRQLKATRRLPGGSKLFRHQLQTKFDVHLALCKGIPGRCLLALVDGMSVIHGAVIAETLNVDRTALQRWRHAPSTLLDIDLACRAWSFAETLAAASQVFGGREAAERWLSAPACALDGRRPVDLLRTMQGASFLADLLRGAEANSEDA